MKLFNNKDDNEDAIEVINNPEAIEVINSTNPSDMDNNIQKSSNLNISFSDIICYICLLYTSPSPRDRTRSRMPSSA